MARAALIVFATTGKPFDCASSPTVAPAYGGPAPTVVVGPMDAAGMAAVAAYGAPAPPPTTAVDIGPVTPTADAGASPKPKDAGAVPAKDAGAIRMAVPAYGLPPNRNPPPGLDDRK